jgi:hypothetical protein
MQWDALADTFLCHFPHHLAHFLLVIWAITSQNKRKSPRHNNINSIIYTEPTLKKCIHMHYLSVQVTKITNLYRVRVILTYRFLCIVLFWDKFFWGRPSWQWTYSPPASASQVLGWQKCNASPGLKFQSMICWSHCVVPVVRQHVMAEANGRAKFLTWWLEQERGKRGRGSHCLL